MMSSGIDYEPAGTKKIAGKDVDAFTIKIDPNNPAAANAARCAGEQGALAYWGMHDQLFANVNQWATDQALQFFSQYAEGLQLDTAAFNSCLESNKYAAAVDADIALGESLGVSSTPSFSPGTFSCNKLAHANPLASKEAPLSTAAAANTTSGNGSPSTNMPRPASTVLRYSSSPRRRPA